MTDLGGDFYIQVLLVPGGPGVKAGAKAGAKAGVKAARLQDCKSGGSSFESFERFESFEDFESFERWLRTFLQVKGMVM